MSCSTRCADWPAECYSSTHTLKRMAFIYSTLPARSALSTFLSVGNVSFSLSFFSIAFRLRKSANCIHLLVCEFVINTDTEELPLTCWPFPQQNCKQKMVINSINSSQRLSLSLRPTAAGREKSNILAPRFESTISRSLCVRSKKIKSFARTKQQIKTLSTTYGVWASLVSFARFFAAFFYQFAESGNDLSVT